MAAYTRMKERDLAREGERFVAEGELVVRRMLAAGFVAESIFAAEDRLGRIVDAVPEGVPVYVAKHGLMNGVLGYKFHSGVMAIGRPKQTPTLAELARRWGEERVTLAILPEVANTDNMGSLIRIASAFGATAVIVGERSCNPFYRQSVRVSMGSIFNLPIVRTANLVTELAGVKREAGLEVVGAALVDDAGTLTTAPRGRRLGVMFGNEAQGLTAEELALCDRKIVIPMRLGTDSLNVSVAAGIFLYHFTQET